MMPSLPRITPYGPKRPLPGERALHQELHCVGREPDEEAGEQHGLPVEQSLHEREDQRPQQREDDQRLPVSAALAHAAFLMTGPPPWLLARRCATARPDFLLEREEEPGRDDEQQDPEPVQRGVVGLGETAERKDLESVRGDTRDDETQTDRVRALGHRELASRLDHALCALGHARGFSSGVSGPCSVSSVEEHTGGIGADWVRSESRSRAWMERISTRMLLILAAITGVAILAAGAIQILLAR